MPRHPRRVLRRAAVARPVVHQLSESVKGLRTARCGAQTGPMSVWDSDVTCLACVRPQVDFDKADE